MPDAHRHIALMKHFYFIRQSINVNVIHQSITHAMCQIYVSLIPKPPITQWLLGSGPSPAAAQSFMTSAYLAKAGFFINFGPKSLGYSDNIWFPNLMRSHADTISFILSRKFFTVFLRYS